MTFRVLIKHVQMPLPRSSSTFIVSAATEHDCPGPKFYQWQRLATVYSPGEICIM